MPGSTTTSAPTVGLPLGDARRIVNDALVAVGYTPEEAEVIADHLMDCELRGLSYAGLARAVSIIERIRATAPPQPIRVDRETPVSAALDGGDQVGYLVAARATEIGLAKARAQGVAVVSARRTWYTGMFSYYLERIVDAGFVGMIAGSAPALVAPHGGTEARFGTNPIAFGFPTSDGPLIWDIGTSSITHAEVTLAARLGEPLPEGKAYDAAGRPTTDAGAALAGAFTVWGGHKGSGLALVVHLLGMLSGASATPVGVSDCGFLAIVMDPSALGDAADFRARAADFAESVRATRPVNSGAPVRVPFDRSAALRAETLRRGTIEVTVPVVETLKQITLVK
ncbi:LDH2 family malate/lactate/ureidoglycolate dehydrogenase [Amycolatopsis bartoniae]|uniref:Lactate dehydrogenase n=1 Tax=Amycolatopsis bartoniae TaxID=941986 RepID=A0A8H9IY40_9PSEU|nr:Ldh family oxidoreductase [Amycolatopsis bartoniae]MBB2936577.1 LDH2 family malate/lactate/ureidoglycolate dehydrogenase [Amycolatopsis bartoniae]TVT09835.1 Ldh family oxidoreductase [Amycolatopsis bartoniae]GHF67935.1 lactate dehydrogenase [Amycolatopsis bartoniae]